MNLSSEEIAKKIREGQQRRKIEKKIETNKDNKQKIEKKTENDEINFMKQAGEIYSYSLQTNPKIEDIASKYQMFYTIFPEVINYMVSKKVYSPCAFQKVLEKRKKMPRTRQANWMLQGTYARELYRVSCTHYDTAKANQIYQDTYNNYESTYKELNHLEEEMKQEREQRDKEYNDERRKELMEFIRSMKAQQEK